MKEVPSIFCTGLERWICSYSAVFNLWSWELVIKQVVSWMFPLDLPIYARWLSFHYRDMSELATKHPQVNTQSSNGCFVVYYRKRLFSSIVLDHGHGEVNVEVKGVDRSAVGLPENPAAFRRLMVAGPEKAQIWRVWRQHIRSWRDSTPRAETRGLLFIF